MNIYQGPVGSNLPQSKLDENDVRLIRKIHMEKQAEIKKINQSCSAKALAEKFSVHYRTIEKVLAYETWRHVY